MKNRKAEKLAMTTIAVWWLRNSAVLVKALHLRRVALRDEQHGFFYTAAMEWRHAAELFAPSTLVSEYCWRQWERIMRLPRLAAVDCLEIKNESSRAVFGPRASRGGAAPVCVFRCIPLENRREKEIIADIVVQIVQSRRGRRQGCS